MNKKVLIVIGIVFIIILLFVFKFMMIKTKGSKTLELTYKTNGGVPYKWEYKIDNESIVQFVETKNITPDKYKNLDGGPVYINFVFKGIKKGKTTITFKYINIVNKSVEKEETVTVKVDRYKNIYLIAVP